MVGIALSMAVAPAAFAVPNHYEIAGGPIIGKFVDPGLVIHTSLSGGLTGTSFTLNGSAQALSGKAEQSRQTPLSTDRWRDN